MTNVKELTNRLQAIEDKRGTWKVTPATGSPDRPISPTMARILHTRALELDVKAWTEQLIAPLSANPEYQAIVSILESHAEDEIKHDAQLDILAEYWDWVPVGGEEWQDLYQRWINHDAHPLAKKLVLEAMGLFQVMALMLICHPEDLFTQTVRQWILFDESAHVSSARLLARALGIKVPRSLIQLGEDLVVWMCEDLEPEISERMVKIANGILREGKAEGDWVSTITNPEFFTQTTNQRIKY
jgi:hypothetical protein